MTSSAVRDSCADDRTDDGAVAKTLPHVSSVVLDDAIALYDGKTHALVMLNAGASEVWEGCDGRTRFDELVARIARRHDVAEFEVREDVSRTLRAFASLGLVSGTG